MKIRGAEPACERELEARPPARRQDQQHSLDLDPKPLSAALVLIEAVPPGGRPLNLFERTEGLADLGLKSVARTNGVSVYRVHPMPGHPDVFALVRWFPTGGRNSRRWRMKALPVRLTWQSIHVRDRVRRGDRQTWLSRDDWERDPLRCPAPEMRQSVPRAARREPETPRQHAFEIFLAERCTINPNARIALPDLVAAWADWCKSTGCPLPRIPKWVGRNLVRAFPGVQLAEARLKPDSATITRIYIGIGARA